MEIKEKRRVRVTETLPISRPTVTGLLETFQTAFRGRDKPVRILYSKGEDLLVERTILREDEIVDDLLTTYQMVRQHAELEIRETLQNSLLSCCFSAQELRDSGHPLTFIVTADKDALLAWLPKGVRLDDLFGVDLFFDPDTPEDCLFFCGSSVSPMIRDIEKAICCRMV